MDSREQQSTEDASDRNVIERLKSGEPDPVETELADGTYADKAGRGVGGVTAIVKYAMEADQHRQVMNEVAAYRVDRILDLSMVPPTALRTLSRPGIDGEYLASVQEWMDDVNEFVGLTEFDEKASIEAAAFDWLIENRDRNRGNILKAGPQTPHGIVLVDHERAFGFRSQPRTELWGPRRGDALSDEFLARVERLAHVARNSGELRDVITPEQLDRLAARADALVEERRVPMNWDA